MMQYAEKLQIQQEARRYSFDYSRGADLNVKFDPSKKLPPVWWAKAPPLPPSSSSTQELDGYGWQCKKPLLFSII